MVDPANLNQALSVGAKFVNLPHAISKLEALKKNTYRSSSQKNIPIIIKHKDIANSRYELMSATIEKIDEKQLAKFGRLIGFENIYIGERNTTARYSRASSELILPPQSAIACAVLAKDFENQTKTSRNMIKKILESNLLVEDIENNAARVANAIFIIHAMRNDLESLFCLLEIDDAQLSKSIKHEKGERVYSAILQLRKPLRDMQYDFIEDIIRG